MAKPGRFKKQLEWHEERELPDGRHVDVHIIRSERRHKSISARRIDANHIIVRVPAALSAHELTAPVERLLARIAARQRRHYPSDRGLERRAADLNKRLFEGKLTWQSIRYVSNQQKRLGSCTPAHGTIRISDRLLQVPDWVLDYVIVHELAHLKHADHSQAFWDLVCRYPLTERARGYLMAFEDQQAITASE